MANVTITIPPVSDYRYHLGLVTTFILAHLTGEPNGIKSPIDFQGIVDTQSVLLLTKKLSNAKPDKPFKVSLKEALLFYTCFILMNKILVSKHDEVLTTVLLKILPANHQLKEFKAFRDEMLHVNTYLIADSEKKFVAHKECTTLKERLAEIDLG